MEDLKFFVSWEQNPRTNTLNLNISFHIWESFYNIFHYRCYQVHLNSIGE
uniref:Uncharacterized protein n=1 Tax=Rhizophora mucronata TaxID=61149 RepID=A0A2P2P9S4_RHIMU